MHSTCSVLCMNAIYFQTNKIRPGFQNYWSDNRKTSIFSGARKSYFFRRQTFWVWFHQLPRDSISSCLSIVSINAIFRKQKKLHRCSTFWPDNPNISTFTGGDLKQDNSWKRKFFHLMQSLPRYAIGSALYATAIYSQNNQNLNGFQLTV